MPTRTFRFLLGANYWPRTTNIRMWSEWRPDEIREDLKRAKDLGLRVLRIFLLALDFGDADGGVREEALVRLREFLDMMHEHGLGALVTLIVGHMSGKNWPLPWAPDSNIYSGRGLKRTLRFIERVVRTLRDHPALVGWIVSNELSIFARPPDRETALAFLKTVCRTIRAADPDHMVSSGDVPDGYLQEPPNVRGLVDYVGPHLYVYDNDPVRHGFKYGALIELFSCGGTVEVILEEFGFSTHQYSEDSHAAFVREVLYTALAHGARGALIWCLTDFKREVDPPYEWKPLELGFGLIRADGSEKPAAEEVREFSRALSRLEEIGLFERFRRQYDSAVVVPFFVFRDYEFVPYRRETSFWDAIEPVLIGHQLCTMAGLTTAVAYELDRDVLRKFRILVAPSVPLMLSTTWRFMLDLAKSGGIMYASLVRAFDRLKALHEAPTHLWDALFGVVPALRAGAIGRKLEGMLKLKFTGKYAQLAGAHEIAINVPRACHTYDARPIDADVVAVDQSDKPVIFAARRGRGFSVLSLVPLELLLAKLETVNWSFELCAIMRLLMRLAGITPRYVSSDPRVEIQTYVGGDNDIVFVINHSWEHVKCCVKSSEEFSHVSVVGGRPISLEARGRDIIVELAGKGACSLLVQR